MSLSQSQSLSHSQGLSQSQSQAGRTGTDADAPLAFPPRNQHPGTKQNRACPARILHPAVTIRQWHP
eukprot:3836101-Rhodomonas_salina.1